jgi:hypothetical protein
MIGDQTFYIKLGLLILSPCVCAGCARELKSCMAMLFIACLYIWVLIVEDDTCSPFLQSFYLLQVILLPFFYFTIYHLYNFTFKFNPELVPSYSL